MNCIVDDSRIIKVLEKLPKEICAAYSVWRNIVLMDGLKGLRMVKGFHFEKLKGNRGGQYSCRLNRGYRVIFIRGCDVIIVVVLEVSKHEY